MPTSSSNSQFPGGAPASADAGGARAPAALGVGAKPAVAGAEVAGTPARYRDVFAVREFRLLLAGFGVFLVGETVKMLALSVLVYGRTGSALLAAFAYVTGFLPYAVGGVLLLALADRWRPRALMVGYDLLRLATVAVLAVGVLPPGAMLGLVFGVGLLAPVAGAARTALLPELLRGDAYVLGRSLLTVVAGGTQVAGFAVGGLLLDLVGPYGALWLAAATCGLSALIVRCGLADRPARATSDAGHNAVRETWRANRSLLSDRPIRRLLLAQWLPGSLLVGAEGVVVPYASQAGEAGRAGLLLTAGALGMLAGDLLVGRVVAPHDRERCTPWLALLLGVPMLFFLLRPAVAVAAALFAVAASGFAYQLGLARRFLAAVPEARRGQAFGLGMTGLMTTQGLAAAAAGALAELVPPGTAMAAAGAGSMAATLALWRVLSPGDDRATGSRQVK